jgi:ATP-binding cassette subfamily G (WHITE) protein 2 (SNQ2)
VQFWDNSTRGLDASTALDFAKVLRADADTLKKTIAATFYQAGNGIYDQFDKVLVLIEGRQAYYGPGSLAKEYFEDMGFVCPDGANIADFLTAVAVPTERQVLPGMEKKVPSLAEEFETRYQQSDLCRLILNDVVDPRNLHHESVQLKANISREQKKSLVTSKRGVYNATLSTQIMSCTVR